MGKGNKRPKDDKAAMKPKKVGKTPPPVHESVFAILKKDNI